jgi:hypothetical protein
MSQKNVLTQEVAAILGVSLSTVHEWINEKNLPPLNEASPYQFDLEAIYHWMKTGYHFNLEAYPFLKQESEYSVTLNKDKKEGLFKRSERTFQELFDIVSNNQPLTELNINHMSYDQRFMSSKIKTDGLGGGIWDRYYCFGAMYGDGVDGLMDIVIPDKLIIKESIPCDYGGDHSIIINGKTKWVNFALDFLNLK